MIELPVCRWRGKDKLDSGRYVCMSPKIMAPMGVSEKDCQGCSLCNHDPQMPGLAQQATSVATAITNFIAQGLPLCSPDERNQRLEICKTCEYYMNERCGKCGCVLAFKLGMKSEHCPVGKW